MEDIRNTLQNLAEADDRGDFIRSLLTERGVPFRDQRFPRHGKTNILVDFGHPPEAWRHVYGAHYDAVSGSPGANDNGAACLSLVHLAARIHASGETPPLCIVFFDGEEPENRYDETGAYCPGSYLFAEELMFCAGQPELAVVLDVTGFGDTLLWDGPGDKETPMTEAVRRVVPDVIDEWTPTSDERLMADAGMYAILLTVIPSEEIDGPRTTWSTLHSLEDNADTVDPENIPWISGILWCLSRPLTGLPAPLAESKAPSDAEARQNALDALYAGTPGFDDIEVSRD